MVVREYAPLTSGSNDLRPTLSSMQHARAGRPCHDWGYVLIRPPSRQFQSPGKRNPGESMDAPFEFCVFRAFGFVSDFVLRISDFQLSFGLWARPMPSAFAPSS